MPRLMAAGADLNQVFRIDVVTEDGFDGLLTLPSDISALFDAVASSAAALLLLDPLMSRLSAHLDSHKDAEVRIALEPLTAFAKHTGISVLGIIHVNKSGSGDALNSIMGSRAFGSVARAVLMAVRTPKMAPARSDWPRTTSARRTTCRRTATRSSASAVEHRRRRSVDGQGRVAG